MKYTYILLLSLCFIACGDDDTEGCAPKNVTSLAVETLIDNYITDNNLNPELNSEGLYYIINTPGGAERPSLSDTVTVNYRGYYRNDCEFDANDGISFGLTNLIEAWQIGIPLLGRGGSMQMIVPPSLGYGNNTPPGLKAGEPLIFDIELLDF